jgi:alginate O-acetyltransferase complex protein AlgI
MLFNSYLFLLVFLPASILIYALVDNSERWRTWILILLSLTFYSYWDVRFLPVLVTSILVNWGAARLYDATGWHLVIKLAVVANLTVLGAFKYVNFFADNLSSLLAIPLPHFALLLPLGISFFTFHHIMYLVDLGGGRAPIYPLDRYALYICFFPQAIAGPMARWNQVMDQFGKRVFAPGWEHRCVIGATMIVLGLMQKVLIGDPLGSALDPIYDQALLGPVSDGKAWMAPAFAFQVFFDFAGYSDIAIGLALIFGVELPRNFDAPFRTTSILEFWQHWHMTLARFLRDYVFTPLSNLRIGGRAHRITRLWMALLLTMTLCGLWHGASWNYVLWGTVQGLAMIFAAAWRRYMPPLPASIGWAATIGFFVATIVIFRAGSLAAAWRIYAGMTAWPVERLDGRDTLIVAFIVAVVFPPSHDICRRLTKRPNRLVAAGLAAAGTLIIALLGQRENFQFVYFQF